MKVAPRTGQRKHLIAADAVAMGVVGDVEHHADRHHGAGHDAAQEQRADGDVGHHAVDHERQGRRDDRAQGGRGRRDADRELGLVAMVLHGLDLDGAEAGGVGDCRARHAREDHRAHDVDVPEAAAHPARQRHGEVVDAVGDAGRVHQVAGEDEERHGQQREAVDAAGHAVQDHEVGDARDEVGVEEGGAGERDEHGHAGDQYGEEDEDEECHGCAPQSGVTAWASDMRQPVRALRHTRPIWRNSIRKQPSAMPP